MTLGIDLGWVEPRSSAFVATYLVDDERRFVADGAAGDEALRANLVWCAKEAVLKALGLGLTVDTRAVRCVPGRAAVDPVEWPMHPAGHPWQAFVVTCDPDRVPGAGTIRGAWCTLSGFVAAVAVARDQDARITRGSVGTPST